MIEPEKLSNTDQVATVVQSVVSDGPAAGQRAIDARAWNGIDVRLYPDRGLDIGPAWFLGTPLAWISRSGELPPPSPEELTERRWFDVWQGALGPRADSRTSALRRRAGGCTAPTRREQRQT